jgi:hypothetical protein
MSYLHSTEVRGRSTLYNFSVLFKFNDDYSTELDIVTDLINV